MPAGAVIPISSSFGITGADSTTWSVIQLPITENYTYQLQFDLKVNQENTSNAWGVGISNNLGAWKFAENWGQLLQIHDSSGSDKLVNWTRSPGIHHFEVIVSPVGNTPFIVKEDGTLLYELNSVANFNISSIVVSILGKGDYEMANFALSTYESPTPTPTMEPTITPTPTPTNTPTPTPTPTATPTPFLPKKIVILHGAGGSWNKDALMNCKTDNYSGTWSPWKISNFDIYQPLINAIDAAGYTSIPYYYDWRQTAANTSDKFNSFISGSLASKEKFDIVGHSFGGLVARAYIESKKENSRVDRLLTVGTPHQGSIFAYPAWSGGEMWLDDASMRLGYTIMKIGCLRRGLSAREMVNNTLPSIQNLLPTFDYIRDLKGQLKPVSKQIAKNNWLPTPFESPYFDTTIKTIVGTGYATLKTLEVKGAGKLDTRLGNWLDGEPTKNNTYGDGDGTVLAESAQLPGALHTALPLSHAALIYDSLGINTIINLLNGDYATEPLHMSNQQNIKIKPEDSISALMIIIDGARATLIDENGNRTEDSEGQITILNPQEKTYMLDIYSKKSWWKTKYTVFVIQLFDDSTFKWKEYNRHDHLKKRFKIRFDHTRKHEDILQDH